MTADYTASKINLGNRAVIQLGNKAGIRAHSFLQLTLLKQLTLFSHSYMTAHYSTSYTYLGITYSLIFDMR